MKIIHVEDYFDPNAGYQINKLISGMAGYNHEIIIISSYLMSPFHKKFNQNLDFQFEKNHRVKILRLKHLISFSSRIYFPKLFKTIDSIDPDIVFLHGIGDFKDLVLLQKKKKYKIFRDCHMSWIASRNPFRNLFFFVFKLFFAPIINNSNIYYKVFALGDEEFSYLKRLGIKSTKIDFLFHGYDKNTMYFDNFYRNKIRSYYGIKQNKIVLTYIGKINKFKNPVEIFEILSLLNTDFLSRITLFFVGSIEESYKEFYIKNLTKFLHKFKIDFFYIKAQPYSELFKYYSATDIFIAPNETTISSIDAQICGCSVIMKNYISNCERVLDKTNLYSPNDQKHAANILKKIIRNNYDRRKLISLSNKYFKVREYQYQTKKLLDYFYAKRL